MPYQDDFEKRRRERRRRARRRKKRIRAAILLVALIGVIALGVFAISTIAKNRSESDDITSDTDDNTISETMLPEPTQAPPAQTSLNIPPASEEADLIEIIADSNQIKRCYLTFDDGPTDNITPQILDVLRRYNIKATFFEVGSMIEANPDMARRVYEEGHLIANHSAGHNYDKVYASTEDFINEINNCFDTIRGVMDGEDPFPLFRFPGGSYNAGDHAEMKQECKNVLAQNGYYYCDWNCLNGDAEGRTKDAQGLYEYFVNTSEGYNNLIVLMHDAATKQATADALPSIIDYLINQGYTFHRLDDIDYNPTGIDASGDTSSFDDESSDEDVSPGSVSASGASNSGSSGSSGGSSNGGTTNGGSSSSSSGTTSGGSSNGSANSSLGTTTRTSVNGNSTVTTNSSSNN